LFKIRANRASVKEIKKDLKLRFINCLYIGYGRFRSDDLRERNAGK